MADQNQIKSILKDYDSNKVLFNDCESKLLFILKECLHSEGVLVHNISVRVKERDRLEEKIIRKNFKYKSIEEITDVVGARIVTMFSSDVDRVANIVEKEFEIDRENSVDKRKYQDPSSFGYISLHYVVKLDKRRKAIPEYSKISSCPFEIQIRSILQHSWAEIEHELGYKNSIEVPKHLLRDFSRIASLLELADNEFVRIRGSIQDYKSTLGKLPKADIAIDKESISHFINNNEFVLSADSRIAKKVGVEITDTDNSSLLKLCEIAGIKTLSELQTRFLEKMEIVVKLAQTNIAGRSFDQIGRGLSLLYYFYIWAMDRNNKNEFLGYLREAKLGSSDENPIFVENLSALYAQVLKG
jgi:putative GTP pyrophosphokinase